RSFASPFRSTVPLISLVKDSPSVLQEIVKTCGCSGECSMHFEYCVEPPDVVGNPSQTDAMIMCDHCALAVEAKWTEPRYETVEMPLKSRVAALTRKDLANTNTHLAAQQSVISSWLKMLSDESTSAANTEHFGDAVYQMVHRAASARASSSCPRLAYLH